MHDDIETPALSAPAHTGDDTGSGHVGPRSRRGRRGAAWMAADEGPGGSRGRRGSRGDHDRDGRDDRGDDGRPRRGRGRGGRGRGDGGPGAWGGPMGPGGPRGFGGPGSGAPKVRRGDTRDAVLLVLLDGPMHGYQIMGELAERSGGAWTPSPGSVYPVLKQLAAEKLVTSSKDQGRRIIELTDAGSETAEARLAEGPPPWESLAEDADQRTGLWESARQLSQAVGQVADAGTQTEIEQATELLDGVRRQLYRILAGDPPTT